MSTSSRMTASAVVGGLVLLCLPPAARAQDAGQLRPVAHIASIAAGSIQGTVQDEAGAPVAGAAISALGASSAFAVSDRSGRFEMRTLSPGPYLLRAHLSGFVASRGQVVDVRPSARASSAIALRHVNAGVTPASYPVLAAGAAAVPDAPIPAPAADPAAPGSTGIDDHGELAWRLRHSRRTILKDATVPEAMVAEADAPSDGNGFGGQNIFGRVTNSSARLASNFFSDTPFSGQVNLLTTGSFDTPRQLFTADNFAHNTAYLALGAPVGEHADWTVRAALTQGDLASWIVAGEYTTRAPARHRYDIGLSYSTQRYEGGNFAALRDVTDGSRNAGTIYAFDTFSISPILTLTYGSRYARYDYLESGGSLISPRVAVTLEPADHFRISTMMSSRAVAPGAEEFMPRIDSGVLLPPQRTFSSIAAGRPFAAERTNHLEVEVERDIASATVSLRAFRQRVSDQIVTLFGGATSDAPSVVGHYFLGNVGDVDASGLSAGIRAAIAGRVHGAVEYSIARARVTSRDLGYMVVLDPASLGLERERIHDLATSIETDVPETATRVVVLYRVSNAFARASTAAAPALDARFDVQVRQSLPFMDFSNAKWEMLVAVRNFFRETAADQSIYDELLVVRPPKRIVGGLTLKF